MGLGCSGFSQHWKQFTFSPEDKILYWICKHLHSLSEPDWHLTKGGASQIGVCGPFITAGHRTSLWMLAVGWGRPWQPLRTRPWCRPGLGLSTPCSEVLECGGPVRSPDGGWRAFGSAPWASSECQSHSGGHSWCRQARWERRDNDETPDRDNKIHELSTVNDCNKINSSNKCFKKIEDSCWQKFFDLWPLGATCALHSHRRQG